MSQSDDKKENKKTPDLSEEQVKKYLEDNRDFFDRHADLIGMFEFSHARGKPASLFEKQVSVLREKNVELRHRISTLTNNAKKNDAIFKNSRDLILSLLDAKNLDELKKVVELLIPDLYRFHDSQKCLGQSSSKTFSKIIDSQHPKASVTVTWYEPSVLVSIISLLFPETIPLDH